MDNLITYLIDSQFLYSVFRVTTPLLFAALASVVAENAGASNIALEGIMIFAALFGAIGSGISNSLIIGLLCAISGGLIISLLLSYFGLYLKTDIILSGIALNTLASGGSVFLLYVLLNDKGSTQALQCLTFPVVTIPLINKIPFLGEVLSGQNLLTYIAFFMVWVVFFLLYRTKIGKHLRCVGENPEAAESVGLNVRKLKLTALMISGLLASLGGAFLSMGYMAGFSRGMVSGRGFIALAAAAMGMLSPVPTMIASIIFGFADAVSNILAALRIPDELVKLIPYLVTIVGLIVFSQIRSFSEKKRRKKILSKT
ncbi:MAG: ABC transporter permease [Sphaerochaetaceae bacterium]